MNETPKLGDRFELLRLDIEGRPGDCGEVVKVKADYFWIKWPNGGPLSYASYDIGESAHLRKLSEPDEWEGELELL